MSTPVGKRVRFEVLRRDQFTCQYCGAKAPDVELAVDHVIPQALGGSNDPSNLVAACVDCNFGKSATPLDAEYSPAVDAFKARWAEALAAVAEERSLDQEFRDLLLAEFKSAWEGWAVDGIPVPIGPHWERSVNQWLNAGTEISDLLGLIPDVMAVRLNTPQLAYPLHRWKRYGQSANRLLNILQARARDWATENSEPDAEPYQQGYQDGWEAGVRLGRRLQGLGATSTDPTPLSELLRPPKKGT